MAAEFDSGLLDFPSLLETVKGCDPEQLVEIVSTASAALKKFVKTMGARKVNSANPVGVMPAPLVKNGAWVDCVLARAQREGWDAFVVQTKSKKTGTVVAEQMTHSVVGGNGVHVFADTGKAFTRKHAMVYGKVLKDGSSNWYSDFERAYVSDSPVAPKLAKAAVSVVPKSSAEVAEEALRKKELAAEKRKAVAQAKKAEKAEEAAKAAAKKPAAKRTEEWVPEEGISKKWMFEGKVYMRTWMDSMYECVETDDGLGTEGAYLGGFRNDKIWEMPDVHELVEQDMDEEDGVEEDGVDEE